MIAAALKKKSYLCKSYINFHTPFYLSIAEPNLFVTGQIMV